MTTPSNYKTGTVDIGANTYSKPVNTAAIAAVDTGMKMWASESERRFNEGFEEDLQNLRSLQETDPVVRDSIAASELMNKKAVQGGLNPVDQKQLDALEKDYKKLDFLLEQGKLSYDMYRLRGSNLLRNAIMLRPDLGDESRRIAANKLGVDVNNAYMEIWKEGQARMESQLGAGAEVNKVSMAQIDTAMTLNSKLTDVKVQQANQAIINKAYEAVNAGDHDTARRILGTLSWGGPENKGIAAFESFTSATTQQQYTETLGRMAELTKLNVLDKAGFEKEKPNLIRMQQELLGWRDAIDNDSSGILKEKDETLKRIDRFLDPINKVLNDNYTDDEKANIIKGTQAIASFTLAPAANQIVSAISPYSPTINAGTASLVTDGLALSSADSPDFKDYVPQSAYRMTRAELGSAFGTVLFKTENNPEKLRSSTEALSYMLVPFANPKMVGGAPAIHSADQLSNITFILNGNRDELLHRAEVMAKNSPEALKLQVALRYGMISEMQKARFGSLPSDLRQFIEVRDFAEEYANSGVALNIENVKHKIVGKPTQEQSARIAQWAKENQPANDANSYLTFVNDTITMAGKAQGAK